MEIVERTKVDFVENIEGLNTKIPIIELTPQRHFFSRKSSLIFKIK